MTTVTVVIPTYNRAEILPYLLSALARQTYKHFDVVMVVKPSGDGTEELLKQAAAAQLKIQTIQQTQGHIVDAYFLGAKNSTGDIVAFLDDDAIPADDWLEETVKIFNNQGVVSVTGDSFPVLLKNGEMQILKEDEIPSVLSHYEFALFGRPLRGLENYKNSISNSGLIYERGNNAFSRKRGAAKALLRGPSMAINGKILRSINLSPDTVLGCAWEMMLSWHVLKQGSGMVYSPKVKVYHIVHGRTSSRDYLNPRTDLLWAVEAELLFYRLYLDETQFSLLSKLTSDIVRTVHSIKHLKDNVNYYTRKIEGIFFGSIIGAKWVIYKKLNVSYSPLADLKRFQKKPRQL